jgi:hypothetical protein
MLAVGQEHQTRTDERADHLAGEVHERGCERDVHVGRVRVGSARQNADRHRGVEVRAGLEGQEDAGHDGETPPEVDEQPTAVLPLGLGQQHVRHDTATEQDQHSGAQDLAEEHFSERHCSSIRH